MSDEHAIGHNSGLSKQDRSALNAIVRQIESNEEERRAISKDIGAIYKSASDKGFNVNAIRAVIRERRMEREDREILETTIDIYKDALGMLADLPLGQASIAAATKKHQPPTADLDRPDTSNQPF